jgi:hypothetical protein
MIKLVMFILSCVLIDGGVLKRGMDVGGRILSCNMFFLGGVRMKIEMNCAYL